MAKELDLKVFRTLLYFVDSEEDFMKVHRKQKMPFNHWLNPNAGASTQVWENEGWQLIVVSIPKKHTRKDYLPEIISHETAHVVTAIWKFLKEREVGEEANAYLTGYIVSEATKYYKA